MPKRSAKSREQHARPIALVCVSPHVRHGAVQNDPDKLTMVRGKWAWCPSGAGAGHEWRAVKAGSLNALRAQLAEVSRLVDVALNNHPRESTEARKASRPRSRAKRINKTR
jgi:hypothetical protein